MKIAFVTVSHKPITKKSTGGLEIFAFYLVPALQRLGHKVTIFSSKETEIEYLEGARHVPIFPIDIYEKDYSEPEFEKVFALRHCSLQLMSFMKSFARREEFDAIHFSCAQWWLPFVAGIEDPHKIFATVHVNNLTPRLTRFVLDQFNGAHLVNISSTQAKHFPKYNQQRVIHNGIDVGEFQPSYAEGEYYCWLGRVRDVKGLREALLAAKKADVEFIASGSVDYPTYFENEVKPLLDNKRRFIEPVFGKEKSEFLAKAKALLMPVLWEEPFGLVPLEAMAAGTPVIAFARGGPTETVVDGKTGFLVKTVDEMVEKMGDIGQIDRRECRRHVEEKFSSKVMARNYAKYFEES